jgi:hypothetical protein
MFGGRVDEHRRGERVHHVSISSTRTGPEAITPAWNLLLDAFGSQLITAHIDALPEPTWPAWAAMSAAAREAQRELHERGVARGHRDPNMGIGLDPASEIDLELMRQFGPWSIHCEATSAGNGIQLETHDEGAGCVAHVTPRAAVAFGGFLALRGINPDDHFDIL